MSAARDQQREVEEAARAKMQAFIGPMHLGIFGTVMGMPQGFGAEPLMAVAQCLGDLATLAFPESSEAVIADLVKAMESTAAAGRLMPDEARQQKFASYRDALNSARQDALRAAGIEIARPGDKALERAKGRWNGKGRH